MLRLETRQAVDTLQVRATRVSYERNVRLTHPLSNLRRAALQREETRLLEREENLKTTPPQPAESRVVENRGLQPRGSSRTSKWRAKNQKTKKSRTERMQPSVQKFFSVSEEHSQRQDVRETRHDLLVGHGQPFIVQEGGGTESQGNESAPITQARS